MQKLDLQIVLTLTKNSPDGDLTLLTDPKTETGEAVLEKGTEITTEAIPGKETVITTEAVPDPENQIKEIESRDLAEIRKRVFRMLKFTESGV